MQLGGLASGVSSLVNEWCKTYRAVDTSPLPQWCSSAGIPEKLRRGRGQQRCAVQTATGELATDHGGARISGRLNGGPLAWSTWRRVWCGCQKNASFGLKGWVTKGGRYLIPKDSALTHKIRKMIDKEVGTSQSNVIELYEERCVYNFYIEMKVAGSDEASGGFTDQRSAKSDSC